MSHQPSDPPSPYLRTWHVTEDTCPRIWRAEAGTGQSSYLVLASILISSPRPAPTTAFIGRLHHSTSTVPRAVMANFRLGLTSLNFRHHLCTPGHHWDQNPGNSTTNTAKKNTHLLSSPPKGPSAESARAVTGRLCPHSGKGEDFLARRLVFVTKTAITQTQKVKI